MAKSNALAKFALLAGGGYLLYRYYVQPSETDQPEPAGGGIVSETEALLDSLRRTVGGGPQPGDTSSVQGAAGANGNGNGTNGNGDNADDDNGDKEQPLSATLIGSASQHPDFVANSGKLNVHQWNWYLRSVRGEPASAATPDLSAAGSPEDLLTVSEFLGRRSQLGLSGLGASPQGPQFSRWRAARRDMRRTYRRPAYPAWAARQAGGAPCACGPTQCNCYRG